MKRLLFILPISLFLFACEQSDIRTHAANIIYQNCIKNGENPTWCRCLQEDLKTGFSEQSAVYITKGQMSQLSNMEISGARLRCQCRINPNRLAAYGLPCNGVKPLNF